MATTRIKDHLSALVFDQIPEFAQVEYPLFAEFLKAYYSFLEQDQKAQEVLQNIQDYGNVDETVEFLISKFFEQYGDGVPQELSADKRLFLKRISDLYGSKGTEKGYRFLFNVLYNETIDFFYPNTEILKASDGKWIRTFKLSAYQADNSDLFKFENTRIIGDTSGATAVVSNVIKYIEGGLTVYELSIDPNSMTGNFRSYEKIRASKLIHIDGNNYSYAKVRVDLAAEDVYDYYASRISELRNILFEGRSSKQVATRRLANLAVKYIWTTQQLVDVYNELFSTNITTTIWQKINPLVTHPVSLTNNTAYNYYIENPSTFDSIVKEYNADANTIIERILTIAREFNWTPDDLVNVVNPALGRSYVAGDWRQSLKENGPVYEEITAFLYPMLAEIDVVQPGIGYLPGDIVEISSNTGSGALAEVIAVTPTGGIINVRVLESGVNYTTNTVITPVKLANNYVTARQLLRSNVAAVIFDRDHGLKYGDTITIADEDTPVQTGSNTFALTVCAAGYSAEPRKWGVYVDGNVLYQGNATHTVSVYNTISMAFVEHVSYDLRETTDEIEYDSNVYIPVNTIWDANYFIERNMANVGYSLASSAESNVVYVSAASPAVLNIGTLPDHAEIKVQAKVHLIDDWSIADTANINITIDSGIHRSKIARTSILSAPTFTPGTGATMSYVGKQNYSRSINTGTVVMDFTKPSGFTLTADCNIISRSSISTLASPVSVIQSNVAVLGYYSSTEIARSITKRETFDLTGHAELLFEVNKGGSGAWGNEPDPSEYLDLEYSLDNGDTWTQIHRVDPTTLATAGTWYLQTVTIPPAIQNEFPLLRFNMPAATQNTAPQDTWAITSVTTTLEALSVNNGYVNYDSGWLDHSFNTISVEFENTLDQYDRKMFVSNVIVTVKADQSAAMTNKLNSLTSNEIVIVHTYEDAGMDEKNNNNLPAAMARIGASQFTEPTSIQSAYVCIGKVGFAPGQAIEKIADFGDYDTRNVVCANAKIDSGNIVGPSITVQSIPDDRTIQYQLSRPDSESNVKVYLETEAVLSANIGPLVISDPFWKNNDGKLDENMYVQGRVRSATENDPVYYQQFSYVIRTEHPISEWKKYAQELMHPGGIALFGELKLQTIPEDVIDMTPFVVAGVEIQDFFAITADKAQRTSPTSPEFRADATVFPPPSTFNPKKLTLSCPSFAYSGNKIPTEYVTVECMFAKEKNIGSFPNPGEHILFSKYLSYEVKTKNNRIAYRVMRHGYQWVWVDSNVVIVPGKIYVLHLTYDGDNAKLYVNGVLKHQSNNRELSLSLNGDSGVLAFQDKHYLVLNGRNSTTLNSSNTPATCDIHSYSVFRLYNKALLDTEITGNYQHLKDLFNL